MNGKRPQSYQIISSYFEDDCADGLTNEPVMAAILDKNALVSLPALSHFWSRMDQGILEQLDLSVNFGRLFIPYRDCLSFSSPDRREGGKKLLEAKKMDYLYLLKGETKGGITKRERVYTVPSCLTDRIKFVL